MKRVLALYQNGWFLPQLKRVFHNFGLERKLSVLLHTLLGAEAIVKVSLLVVGIRQVEGDRPIRKC